MSIFKAQFQISYEDIFVPWIHAVTIIYDDHRSEFHSCSDLWRPVNHRLTAFLNVLQERESCD